MRPSPAVDRGALSSSAELDLTKMVWPGHPQLADFFLTLIATIVVQLTRPKDTQTKQTKPPKNVGEAQKS
jgi:hypothetical protein